MAAITATFCVDKVAFAPARNERLVGIDTVRFSELAVDQPEAGTGTVVGARSIWRVPELSGKVAKAEGSDTFLPVAEPVEATTANWSVTVIVPPDPKVPLAFGRGMKSEESDTYEGALQTVPWLGTKEAVAPRSERCEPAVAGAAPA